MKPRDAIPAVLSPQRDPHGVNVSLLMKHPVGVKYFMEYIARTDAKFAKALKSMKSIEKYKRKVVPEKKMKLAAKIFKKYVKDNELLSKEDKAQIASQVENFDFAGQDTFKVLEVKVMEKVESLLAAFKQSDIYQTLLSNLGPKRITVRYPACLCILGLDST